MDLPSAESAGSRGRGAGGWGLSGKLFPTPTARQRPLPPEPPASSSSDPPRPRLSQGDRTLRSCPRTSAHPGDLSCSGRPIPGPGRGRPHEASEELAASPGRGEDGTRGPPGPSLCPAPSTGGGRLRAAGSFPLGPGPTSAWPPEAASPDGPGAQPADGVQARDSGRNFLYRLHHGPEPCRVLCGGQAGGARAGRGLGTSAPGFLARRPQAIFSTAQGRGLCLGAAVGTAHVTSLSCGCRPSGPDLQRWAWLRPELTGGPGGLAGPLSAPAAARLVASTSRPASGTPDGRAAGVRLGSACLGGRFQSSPRAGRRRWFGASLCSRCGGGRGGRGVGSAPPHSAPVTQHERRL